MILWVEGRAGLHGPRLSVGLINLPCPSPLRTCRPAANRTPRACPLLRAAETIGRGRRRHILSDTCRLFLHKKHFQSSYLFFLIVKPQPCGHSASPRRSTFTCSTGGSGGGCPFQLFHVLCISVVSFHSEGCMAAAQARAATAFDVRNMAVQCAESSAGIIMIPIIAVTISVYLIAFSVNSFICLTFVCT